MTLPIRCTFRSQSALALRLVGDPVDVIDGGQSDCALDIQVAWPFPLQWRRYYRSSANDRRLALGWGHTHEYDRCLDYTIDGVRYHSPTGEVFDFSVRGDGTEWIGAGGVRIRRLSATRFVVKAAREPCCEFEFAFNAARARLVSMYNSRGRLSFGYDTTGRLAAIQGPGSAKIHVVTGEHQAIRQLVLHSPDEKQPVMLWEGDYDSGGNLVRVKDGYGALQSFAYDAKNRMVRSTNRVGYSFLYEYDDAGRCVSSGGEDGVQLVQLRYLTAERVTEVARADRGRWQYFFNEHKQITLIIDPLGGAGRFEYGGDGALAQEIDPLGNLVRRRDPDTGVTRSTAPPCFSAVLPLGDPWAVYVRTHYNPRHALAWEWMAANMSTRSIRMPGPETLRIKNLPPAVLAGLQPAPTPEAAQPALRRVGRLKRVATVPHPGRLNVDRFGRLVSYQDLLGHARRWQYDANGNVVREVDEAGSAWAKEYGSWNLTRRSIDPVGQRTGFSHDAMEQIVTVTDPGLTATEQSFDLLGRLKERHRHGRKIHDFEYDAGGNLIRWDAPEATSIRFKPGAFGRPVEIAAGDWKRTCAYDERGRLAEVLTRCGEEIRETLSFSYGPLGDLVADLRNGRGVVRSFQAGFLTEVNVLGRYRIGYERKASGEVCVVDPAGNRHVLSNLGSGLFLRRLANGVEELGQYDWDGRCLAKVRFEGYDASKVWRRSYRYTGVGALEQEQINHSTTRHYGYDAAHRLIRESGAGREGGYRYDAAGNLLLIPDVGDARYHHNRLVSAGDQTFAYDTAHRMVAHTRGDRRRMFHYDAENQLSVVEDGEHRVIFSYDALGRRVAKERDGHVTRFVWDDERIAAEIAPTGRVRVYVYADAVARSPILFLDYEDAESDPAQGRPHYIFSNQIACPIRIENHERRVVWQAQVRPYGLVEVSQASALEFNLRWPGHYFDVETGLNYNRRRYYSPELGRYIQPDPLDWPAGINVYAYPARPLDTVDIDGLAPCPPKPMGEALPEDHPMRQRADDLEKEMRKVVAAEGLQGSSTTLTVMVVQLRNPDGTLGEHTIVVAVNSGGRIPEDVRNMLNEQGVPVIRVPPHNPEDGSSTRVTQQDTDSRFGRDRRVRDPETGEMTTERQDTTHTHAEQRALRATDCDPTVDNVSYVAPTRKCCEGCSSAIQSRGGTADNVSPHGQGDGTWWE